MIKKIVGGLLAVVMILGVSGSVWAADFFMADDSGNLTVSADEKVKNLYTGGNIVSIKADVEKSLYLGGNSIVVDGDVENDIFVGGGNVTIRGDVGGSIHAGGGTVIIEGRVADDVFVGGGNIMISETASIGEDLLIGGGVVSVLGSVKGNVMLGAGEATLNGEVGGKVTAETDSLSLGEKAKLDGGLTYKSYQEAKINEGAVVVGEVEYKKIGRKQVNMAGNGYDYKPAMKKLGQVKRMGGLVTSLVAGLVLVYFFGKWVKVVVKHSLTKFGPSLGNGFLTLVVLPILAVVMFITLVGWWVGGVMMTVYTLLLTLATPLASIALGTWVLKIFKGKESKYIVDWRAVVVGAVTIGLLGAIASPFVSLVKGVFMVAALGSMHRLTYNWYKKSR
jgi:cytoskeletal protein CcmA (bactofilin family)